MATPDDHPALIQLAFGQLAGHVLATATNLGVADLIGDGRCTGVEVARAIGAAPGPVTRLLRALAALGLLTEAEPATFRLTGVGALLRTDRPDSLREFVSLLNDPVLVGGFGELSTAPRTGRTTFELAHGVGFFEHLATNPELSQRFNTVMHQISVMVSAELPASYGFSRFHTVLDVGGGDGTVLAMLLTAHPELRGVVYDTEPGLAEAEATLTAAGVTRRCATVIGDFFSSVPDGADLYLIKNVLHDWEDDKAHTILGHIRSVILDSGRLLILEAVLPEVVDGTIPPTMYLLDLNMLVNNGGRERTRTEFTELCTRAGFTVTDVRPLGESGVSLIEAHPT